MENSPQDVSCSMHPSSMLPLRVWQPTMACYIQRITSGIRYIHRVNSAQLKQSSDQALIQASWITCPLLASKPDTQNEAFS
eukprot:1143546-Pelagomonas_calceolata.AAC.1